MYKEYLACFKITENNIVVGEGDVMFPAEKINIKKLTEIRQKIQKETRVEKVVFTNIICLNKI